MLLIILFYLSSCTQIALEKPLFFQLNNISYFITNYSFFSAQQFKKTFSLAEDYTVSSKCDLIIESVNKSTIYSPFSTTALATCTLYNFSRPDPQPQFFTSLTPAPFTLTTPTPVQPIQKKFTPSYILYQQQLYALQVQYSLTSKCNVLSPAQILNVCLFRCNIPSPTQIKSSFKNKQPIVFVPEPLYLQTSTTNNTSVTSIILPDQTIIKSKNSTDLINAINRLEVTFSHNISILTATAQNTAQKQLFCFLSLTYSTQDEVHAIYLKPFSSVVIYYRIITNGQIPGFYAINLLGNISKTFFPFGNLIKTITQTSIDTNTTLNVSQPSIDTNASSNVSQPTIDTNTTSNVSQPSIDTNTTLNVSQPTIDTNTTLNVSQPTIDTNTTSNVSQPSIDTNTTLNVSQPTIDTNTTLNASQPTIDTNASSQSQIQPQPSLTTNPNNSTNADSQPNILPWIIIGVISAALFLLTFCCFLCKIILLKRRNKKREQEQKKIKQKIDSSETFASSQTLPKSIELNIQE